MIFQRAKLGETEFAIVDIEATGIYPTAYDRIIEIAILKVTGLGEIKDEYVTLVNPKRDIGRHDLHGIEAGFLLDAPAFEDIAGDIGARLSNSIIVGHHLRFDLGFLTSEFARLGLTLPLFPTLCTLQLTHKLLPEIPSRKLSHCCEAAGIRHENEHSALGDARATAALLSHYLKCARQSGLEEVIAAVVEGIPLATSAWIPLMPSGRTCCRDIAAVRQAEGRRYLARLVERMLGDETTNVAGSEYLLLLDRAFEDRLVTRSEAEALVASASSRGMKRSEVLDIHRAYLASLASEALSDGVVSKAERDDLESVCETLDLNHAALDEILATAERGTISSNESLRGISVCFTGELTGTINGRRITRDLAEQLAAHAGLRVQSNVTRMLHVLVVSDPSTQSGKAKKAREYGTRVMAASVFWKAIGTSLD